MFLYLINRYCRQMAQLVFFKEDNELKRKRTVLFHPQKKNAEEIN